MNKDVFRTLIIEGQEVLQEVELFERPFEFEEQGRYVFSYRPTHIAVGESLCHHAV